MRPNLRHSFIHPQPPPPPSSSFPLLLRPLHPSPEDKEISLYNFLPTSLSFSLSLSPCILTLFSFVWLWFLSHFLIFSFSLFCFVEYPKSWKYSSSWICESLPIIVSVIEDWSIIDGAPVWPWAIHFHQRRPTVTIGRHRRRRRLRQSESTGAQFPH